MRLFQLIPVCLFLAWVTVGSLGGCSKPQPSQKELTEQAFRNAVKEFASDAKRHLESFKSVPLISLAKSHHDDLLDAFNRLPEIRHDEDLSAMRSYCKLIVDEFDILPNHIAIIDEARGIVRSGLTLNVDHVSEALKASVDSNMNNITKVVEMIEKNISRLTAISSNAVKQ